MTVTKSLCHILDKLHRLIQAGCNTGQWHWTLFILTTSRRKNHYPQNIDKIYLTVIQTLKKGWKSDVQADMIVNPYVVIFDPWSHISFVILIPASWSLIPPPWSLIPQNSSHPDSNGTFPPMSIFISISMVLKVWRFWKVFVTMSPCCPPTGTMSNTGIQVQSLLWDVFVCCCVF